MGTACPWSPINRGPSEGRVGGPDSRRMLQNDRLTEPLENADATVFDAGEGGDHPDADRGWVWGAEPRMINGDSLLRFRRRR